MGNNKLNSYHMSDTKLIYLVKPVMGYIPEVEPPLKKQMFKEKLMWTGTVLFIYLVCCQIPLYGTVKQEGADPLYWLRVILASNKGTLMELGISPIITSSMIMQLLSGTKLIDVNMRSQVDRESSRLLLNSSVSSWPLEKPSLTSSPACTEKSNNSVTPTPPPLSSNSPLLESSCNSSTSSCKRVMVSETESPSSSALTSAK